MGRIGKESLEHHDARRREQITRRGPPGQAERTRTEVAGAGEEAKKAEAVRAEARARSGNSAGAPARPARGRGAPASGPEPGRRRNRPRPRPERPTRPGNSGTEGGPTSTARNGSRMRSNDGEHASDIARQMVGRSGPSRRIVGPYGASCGWQHAGTVAGPAPPSVGRRDFPDGLTVLRTSTGHQPQVPKDPRPMYPARRVPLSGHEESGSSRPQPRGRRGRSGGCPGAGRRRGRGALAKAAGAVLVSCRGAGQADSAVTEWMLRRWAGQRGRPLRGRVQSPVCRSDYP